MPTAWLVFVFWFLVWQVVKRTVAPSLGVLLLGGVLVGLRPWASPRFFSLCRSWSRRYFYAGRARVPDEPVARHFLWLAFSSVRHLRGSITTPLRETRFLSAHSGVNFWIGNNPVANGYPKFPPGLHAGQEAMLQDSITTAEKAAGRPLKRSEVSKFWSAKASAWIHEHPAAWLRLVGVKIRNFWNAFQDDDISVITALRDQGIIFPGISFGLVAALGLPGLLIACCEDPRRAGPLRPCSCTWLRC